MGSSRHLVLVALLAASLLSLSLPAISLLPACPRPGTYILPWQQIPEVQARELTTDLERVWNMQEVFGLSSVVPGPSDALDDWLWTEFPLHGACLFFFQLLL